MNKKTEAGFKIMKFFDDARYESFTHEAVVHGRPLINYYKHVLDNDTKLLTHWICYVSDRQMPARKIWEVGGYVYSEMIDAFKKKGLEVLDSNREESFFFLGKEGWGFASQSEGNSRTKAYEKNQTRTKKRNVSFRSRYYPSDFFSFLATFHYLEKYHDRCFSKFIVSQVKKHHNKEDFVGRLLYSLYLLTYHDIGRRTKDHPQDADIGWAENKSQKVNSALTDEEFESGFISFYRNNKNSRRFSQKRAWCALRDFLKHPEFSELFQALLVEGGVVDEGVFTEMLSHLELPGDVWNNNSTFRACLCDEKVLENRTDPLNYVLRNEFEKAKGWKGNYPEQFDITYDFIPRMCEVDNCDICPIGAAIKSGARKGKCFESVCSPATGKFCPVALACCGYKMKCKGKKLCDLLKILKFSTHEILDGVV